MKRNQVRGNLLIRISRATDKTMDRRYIGQIGRVFAFDPHDCGATEADPMIMVRFADGKHDAFWLEELEPYTETI